MTDKHDRAFLDRLASEFDEHDMMKAVSKFVSLYAKWSAIADQQNAKWAELDLDENMPHAEYERLKDNHNRLVQPVINKLEREADELYAKMSDLLENDFGGKVWVYDLIVWLYLKAARS